MARLDTVVVTDLDVEPRPAPSAESMAAAREAGLTSVVAAPLYARGELLGVMSLALSRLTDREDRNYGAPDRDLIGAIASRVAVAIDNAMLFETERAKQHAQLTSTRKAMMGSGDRSQRIRTYNFPQNRCTDHRLGGDRSHGGEQGGVGAVAGEVFARSHLEHAEKAHHDADDEHGKGLLGPAEDHRDHACEDGDLRDGQAPERSGRPLAIGGHAARSPARRSRAGRAPGRSRRPLAARRGHRARPSSPRR